MSGQNCKHGLHRDECFEEVMAERNRLLTLATKHCPRDHHDWQEILRIAGDA